VSPKKIVEIAVQAKCPSLSYTYTEPTVFLEYALDTMKLAKEAGLKNIWVSNGFFSKEIFELILPPSADSGHGYLDAINVDLKSFDDGFYQKNCNGRLQPILDNLKQLKAAGVWLEITTLIIPTLSDSPEMLAEMADFIANELGKETPWHISKFSGSISWKLQRIPDTPAKNLQTAHQIGKKAGLKYVYIGNIPGIDSESTFCPKCQTKVIERVGYFVIRHDKKGYCPTCNENLNIFTEGSSL